MGPERQYGQGHDKAKPGKEGSARISDYQDEIQYYEGIDGRSPKMQELN